MACSFCTQLPAKLRANIDRHLTEDKKSLLEIANHYSVDINDLRQHLVDCVAPQEEAVPNEGEELAASQAALQGLICQFQQEVAAGKHMEFDPETGMDGRGVISNLLSTMREHRETIIARSKIRTADEVYQDLQANVVGPLISAVTTICIEEGRRTREEIFDLTKRTEEIHPKIKTAVDEMLGRIADRMSTEALYEIPDRVKAVVGAKKTDKRSKPS